MSSPAQRRPARDAPCEYGRIVEAAESLAEALGDDRPADALSGGLLPQDAAVVAADVLASYGLPQPLPQPPQAAAAPAALGNRRLFASPQVNAVFASRESFTMRLGRITPEINDCLTPMPGAGAVWLQAGERGTGFAALKRCGRRLCPACAARLQGARAAEIEATAAAHLTAGHSIAMVTLTMRHHARHALVQCLDAVTGAWRAATGGSPRAWTKARLELGLAQVVRSIEVTHGVNGWHVHVHALLFLDAAPAAAAATALPLAEGMFTRWTTHLAAEGFDPPTRDHGLDVLVGQPGSDGRVLGAYVAKLQDGGVAYAASSKRLGFEVAYAAGKLPKRGNRTPFMIAADALAGDQRSYRLWREYADGIHHRRMLEWSRASSRFDDLRDRYDTRDDRTDEQILDHHEDGARRIAGIPIPAWRHIRRRRQELVDELLGCQTYDDVAALFAADPFLAEHPPLRPDD